MYSFEVFGMDECCGDITTDEKEDISNHISSINIVEKDFNKAIDLLCQHIDAKLCFITSNNFITLELNSYDTMLYVYVWNTN